jgi:hypothetical protein
MAKPDYKGYFITRPDYESGFLVYMSNKLVPGCDKYCEMRWIRSLPEANRVPEHTHHYDEIMLYIGGDAVNQRSLGGEIEYYVGGQPLTFDTTSALYIPKGVRHGPVAWKRFLAPHLEIAVMLGPETSRQNWPKSAPTGILAKKDTLDYEKYLVRKPTYLQGTEVTEAIQSPAGIYVSGELIPGCKAYIDFGWIPGLPPVNPPIPEHSHDYEEIVLNIGNDPGAPEELGAELEFSIASQPLTFNTTTAVYVPKGIAHGPLTWKKLARPHLLMPIIIGAGSLLQAGPAGYKGK